MTNSISLQKKVDFDQISLAAQGDSQALEGLYDRYRVQIFNYLLRLTHDEPIAEELLQEVFLAVWDGAAKFKRRSSVKTWIFRIAHNKAVSWLRRHKSKRDPIPVEENIIDGLSRDHSTPEDDFFSKWRSEQVIAALDYLSENHRAVIELAYVHDFKYAEIAKILNCPSGTVKSRMSYALRHLKRILIGMEFKL